LLITDAKTSLHRYKWYMFEKYAIGAEL